MADDLEWIDAFVADRTDAELGRMCEAINYEVRARVRASQVRFELDTKEGWERFLEAVRKQSTATLEATLAEMAEKMLQVDHYTEKVGAIRKEIRSRVPWQGRTPYRRKQWKGADLGDGT